MAAPLSYVTLSMTPTSPGNVDPGDDRAGRLAGGHDVVVGYGLEYGRYALQLVLGRDHPLGDFCESVSLRAAQPVPALRAALCPASARTAAGRARAQAGADARRATGGARRTLRSRSA